MITKNLSGRYIAAQLSAILGGILLGSGLKWNDPVVRLVIYVIATSLFWVFDLSISVVLVLSVRQASDCTAILERKDGKTWRRTLRACSVPYCIMLTLYWVGQGNRSTFSRNPLPGWLHDVLPGVMSGAGVLLLITNCILYIHYGLELRVHKNSEG